MLSEQEADSLVLSSALLARLDPLHVRCDVYVPFAEKGEYSGAEQGDLTISRPTSYHSHIALDLDDRLEVATVVGAKCILS